MASENWWGNRGFSRWGKAGASMGMMVWAVATTCAAVPPAEAPGKLETYRDWIIGCDNGGGCEAVSLLPEDGGGGDMPATISIMREAGGSAQPVITITPARAARGQVELMVDGIGVARATMAGDVVKFSGVQAYAVIGQLARGARFELVEHGKSLGHASLSGSSSALRYMDARQGRAGTVTALVAKGPLRSAAVRAAPALPVVRIASMPPSGKGEALWQTEVDRVNVLTGCAGENLANAEVEVFPLPHNRSLLFVPCGAGAYNFTSVPVIASGKVGRRTFELALFDRRPRWGDDARVPLLVNTRWDGSRALLTSYAKGRGLGDCGNSEDYVWDGSRFRMVRASLMTECRGARDWITVFRAQVAGVPR